MATRYPDDMRTKAREMRVAGMSVSRITFELGVRSTSVVHRWVADIPPAAWTRRPNAKDELRLLARQRRLEGESLKVIAREVGVAQSSVSVWVRDLPVPPGLRKRAAHAHRMNGARWLRERAQRETERRAVKSAAAAEIGDVSARELLLLGAVLYWAEGSKDKPYDRREKLQFINSDVAVIQLYLAWLDLLGVPAEDRRFRLSIHESADVEGAHEFWSGVTGVPIEGFDPVSLKRHQPKTVRLNVGADYHGCLTIAVSRSRVLYQQMEGWFRGVSAAVTGDDAVLRAWTG